ncbi:MAG: M20 family metallopeptidase [Chloroflexi bacterium]|nr:M20 family metallopeptidase [Chloroflexota bacterium]
MPVTLEKLLSSVSYERLRDLTLALVEIPSPTGEARAVTERYRQEIAALGYEAELVADFPASPSTITRVPGAGSGRSLTLDGHLDTIHTPHAPAYIDGDRVVGRGAGDMKSGIAAMVEVLRVLREHDVRLGGELVLATHSLHEAPVGHMEGLKKLIERGDVFVDAALVTECSSSVIAITGKGQALFEISVTRKGAVLHENTARRQGVPNPLDQAARIAHAMLERNACEAQRPIELLGPETFFLGQIHGGDFYNRVPNKASLNGVYRYGPDKSWQDIEQVIEALLASVPPPEGIAVRYMLSSNGLGYQVDANAPIVAALQQGYQQVTGATLPLVGELSVSDVNVIAREAGIPVVAHGTGSTTSHADVEWVNVSDVVTSTKVYLATIAAYLGIAE